jgi:hypothetical protein
MISRLRRNLRRTEVRIKLMFGPSCWSNWTAEVDCHVTTTYSNEQEKTARCHNQRRHDAAMKDGYGRKRRCTEVRIKDAQAVHIALQTALCGNEGRLAAIEEEQKCTLNTVRSQLLEQRTAEVC